MKETFDLRIVNEFADECLRPDEGKKTAVVRILKIDGINPKLKVIEKMFRNLLAKNRRYLFLGWSIERQYDKQELEQAQTFLLKISSVFEPEGEAQGTKYDDARACPKCGAGAPQITPLYLPEKRIPKSRDINRTIAGEIVVSRRLKELFTRHQITGVRLTPVRYSQKASAESPDWFQLTLTHNEAEVASQSWVGLGLFQEDIKGEYSCPRGDTIGLNLVSELFIDKPISPTTDVIGTQQFFGARQGVLRPERKIIISPRLYRLLEAEKIKGYKVEVAHLV